MADLLIPCGETNSGRFVRAADAIANEQYRCPSCAKPLVLRAGQRRQKHFSHPSEGACSYESVMHKTAKHLLAQVIKDNTADIGDKIEIQTCCDECKKQYWRTLPARTFTGAAVEVTIESFRCDVAAYRGDEIALVLEVLFSSPISDKKSKNLDGYWVELIAEDVVNNPYQWKPVRSHLKETVCLGCSAKFQRIRNVAEKWGIAGSLYSVRHAPDKATYIAGLEKCFKCKEEIPVFWWLGVPFCQEEPPKPRPATIQRRRSKQWGGSYWANTCPNCKSIQGDNYLFLFEKAPLGDLPKSQENLPKPGPGEATKLFSEILRRNLL